MSDFGSGLEQYGPMHELSGGASKADLRRRIADLEQFNAQLRANLEHEDAKRRRAEARADALYEKRLPCREVEIAQKRYEDAEAERDKWEWVARHADRPSLMDRPNLCERNDTAIAFILARWAERSTP